MADLQSSPSRAALVARIAKYAYHPPEPSSVAGPSGNGYKARAWLRRSPQSPDPPTRSRQTPARKKGGAGRGVSDAGALIKGDDEMPVNGADSDEYRIGDAGSDEEAVGGGAESPTGRSTVLRAQPSTPAKRRKLADETSASPSPVKKGKAPRGYAAPEVYAHLSNTPDHLKQGLTSTSLAYNTIAQNPQGRQRS